MINLYSGFYGLNTDKWLAYTALPQTAIMLSSPVFLVVVKVGPFSHECTGGVVFHIGPGGLNKGHNPPRGRGSMIHSSPTNISQFSWIMDISSRLWC